MMDWGEERLAGNGSVLLQMIKKSCILMASCDFVNYCYIVQSYIWQVNHLTIVIGPLACSCYYFYLKALIQCKKHAILKRFFRLQFSLFLSSQ